MHPLPDGTVRSYNGHVNSPADNTVRILACVLVSIFLGRSMALAANGSAPTDAPGPRVPPQEYLDKTLPEVKGVVSWKTLAEVTAVRQNDKFVPNFSPKIAQLDRKEVRLQGFMLPMEAGERHKNFILTSTPPSCPFCLPGGPDAVVEIRAKTPIKYGEDPIVLSGRFSVLKDDPAGLFYRLTDAVAVSVK